MQILGVETALAPQLYVLSALAARRLHDVGLSAWWLAVFYALGHTPTVFLMRGQYPPDWAPLTMALGSIGFIVAMFWPSAKGENRFGPPNTDPD